MGCGLAFLGGILGVVLGPIVGTALHMILFDSREDSIMGFMVGGVLGPFVGMVALPLLLSLVQRLLRRR